MSNSERGQMAMRKQTQSFEITEVTEITREGILLEIGENLSRKCVGDRFRS
jgi:hypothetical protein